MANLWDDFGHVAKELALHEEIVQGVLRVETLQLHKRGSHLDQGVLQARQAFGGLHALQDTNEHLLAAPVAARDKNDPKLELASPIQFCQTSKE